MQGNHIKFSVMPSGFVVVTLKLMFGALFIIKVSFSWCYSENTLRNCDFVAIQVKTQPHTHIKEINSFRLTLFIKKGKQEKYLAKWRLVDGVDSYIRITWSWLSQNIDLLERKKLEKWTPDKGTWLHVPCPDHSNGPQCKPFDSETHQEKYSSGIKYCQPAVSNMGDMQYLIKECHGGQIRGRCRSPKMYHPPQKESQQIEFCQGVMTTPIAGAQIVWPILVKTNLSILVQ